MCGKSSKSRCREMTLWKEISDKIFGSTVLIRMGCILLILRYIYETGLTGMQQIQNIMDSVSLLFFFFFLVWVWVCKICPNQSCPWSSWLFRALPLTHGFFHVAAAKFEPIVIFFLRLNCFGLCWYHFLLAGFINQSFINQSLDSFQFCI